MMLRKLLPLTLILVCFLCACDRPEQERKYWTRFTEASREMWENPALSDDKKVNFAGAFTGEKGHYFIFNIYEGKRDPAKDAPRAITDVTSESKDRSWNEVRTEEIDFHGDKLPLTVRWVYDKDLKADPRLVMVSPMGDADIRDKYHFVMVYSHTGTTVSDEDRADIEQEMKANLVGFFEMMHDQSERRENGRHEKEERLKREKQDSSPMDEEPSGSKVKAGFDESVP